MISPCESHVGTLLTLIPRLGWQLLWGSLTHFLSRPHEGLVLHVVRKK